MELIVSMLRKQKTIAQQRAHLCRGTERTSPWRFLGVLRAVDNRDWNHGSVTLWYIKRRPRKKRAATRIQLEEHRCGLDARPRILWSCYGIIHVSAAAR